MALSAWPRAYRVFPLAGALVLALVAPTATVAQDDAAGSSAEPEISPSSMHVPGASLSPDPTPGDLEPSTAGDVASGAPRRFREAEYPSEAPIGSVLNDVISGGPGYIAVGGGSWRPREYLAVAWTSEDGRTWRAADVDGDAVDGNMEAVAALPGGGYVAVGRDSEPLGGRNAEPPDALVWHSADGQTWSAVPVDETFSEAIMYDIATTADGVIAVGCKADSASLCSAGRAWTSADGIEWDLQGELPIVPFTVTADGSMVATGGTDKQADRTDGRASAALQDEEGWSPSGPLWKRWSDIAGSSTMDAGVVMVGSKVEPEGGFPRTALFVTADGETWDRVSGPSFRRMQPGGLAISGDLVLVVGIKPSADIGYPPVALWSRDMEDFREARFPDDVSGEGLELIQPLITDDGSLAIVVGAYQQRPRIWISELE